MGMDVLLKNIFVMLFAAAIVALGAAELNRSYGKHIRSGLSADGKRGGKDLAGELHGRDIRANPSSGAAKQASAAEDGAPLKKESQPRPKMKTSSDSVDNLSRKDRRELSDLLDKVGR